MIFRIVRKSSPAIAIPVVRKQMDAWNPDREASNDFDEERFT